MKFILLSFLLVCIFASALGGDGCTFKGKSLEVGEKYAPPGKCAIYTCEGQGHMSAVGCPSSEAPLKCKRIPQDNSKSYPDCCERFECP
ncbi:la1-like protein 15 [Eupeodes corollae]|uniref:la1-like protein 15 n=1 Tax=Eupeodes corollae TaxID=290404 RepID=UPI00248FEA72|nr:la1-like protein 15 [Eupeodes corollae]